LKPIGENREHGGRNQMRRKISSDITVGVLAVLLALTMAVGVAEEEKADTSGQWRYLLEAGGATIIGCEELVLSVKKGSYAEQYAKDNEISYVFALPYKDLSAHEILCVTVEIFPLKVRGELSDDEIDDLVAILRTIEINNRDDSHNEYGGQAVIFTIVMTDGAEEVISAFNPFIIINGIGYRTDVCYELSGLGGTIAKTPF